jgi:hypothetical protein
VKIEQLALVQAWAEAGHLFSERERAALAWAEAVTHVSETGVPDAAFQAARAAFEEKELVDLTIAIEIYGCDLVLVRPDLHVVWRGNSVPAHHRSIAMVATGHA